MTVIMTEYRHSCYYSRGKRWPGGGDLSWSWVAYHVSFPHFLYHCPLFFHQHFSSPLPFPFISVRKKMKGYWFRTEIAVQQQQQEALPKYRLTDNYLLGVLRRVAEEYVGGKECGHGGVIYGAGTARVCMSTNSEPSKRYLATFPASVSIHLVQSGPVEDSHLPPSLVNSLVTCTSKPAANHVNFAATSFLFWVLYFMFPVEC